MLPPASLPLRAVRATASLLLSAALFSTLATAGDYRPPQDRTIYDDWMRDIRDRRAAQERANAYKPGPARPRDDSAQVAAQQFMQANRREWDDYNARVARENARIDAQNAYYAQLRELSEAAKAGDVSAMWRYGYTLYIRDDSSAREKEIGLQWVELAAKSGSRDAAQWIAQQGSLFAEKQRQIADASKLEAYHRNLAGAREGDLNDMVVLGILYYDQGTPEQQKESEQWRRLAIQKNERRILTFVRDKTRHDGPDPVYRAEALDVRLRLAEIETDAPERMYELGDCFLTGRFGAPIDRARAVKYLDRAVAQGKAAGNLRIAEAYAQGIGGPVDVDAAVSRYLQALEKGPHHVGAALQAPATLALTRLAFDPKCTVLRDKAELLLGLWFDGIVGDGREADSLGILAANAIRSGQVGAPDEDRALLFESRPMLHGEWSAIATDQEWAGLQRGFGERLLARAKDTSTPFYVVRPKVGSDSSEDGFNYKIDTASAADAIPPLRWAAQHAANQNVEDYLFAARAAATVAGDDFEHAGLSRHTAFEIYEEAARKFNDAGAWWQCALHYFEASRIPANIQSAAECLEHAWAAGSAEAAFHLAGLHQRGLLPHASPEQGWSWLERGAEKQDPRCMDHWGNHLVAKGIQEKSAADLATGRQWLEKAAAAGQADAYAELASIYEKGFGVPADNAKSLVLLQQAVDAGSAEGKRTLAERLANGAGIAVDKPRALKLLHESAKTDLTAANNLGVILWRGDWGEKDVDAGLQWMEVTLEAGFWQTGRNLAKIYHLGLGVPADEDKARAYLWRAAELGGPEAVEAIAEFFERGEIIGKDLEAAANLRERAKRWTETHAGAS